LESNNYICEYTIGGLGKHAMNQPLSRLHPMNSTNGRNLNCTPYHDTASSISNWIYMISGMPDGVAGVCEGVCGAQVRRGCRALHYVARANADLPRPPLLQRCDEVEVDYIWFPPRQYSTVR
jgi:hypothetical protein